MGISIGALEKSEVTDEERQEGLHLGKLSKANPNWVAALGFDDLPVAFSSDPKAREVDGDLWVMGLGKDGKALDLVRYDPEAPKRIVESIAGTGAYTYLGDARSGSEIQGDDEQTIIRHDKAFEAGIRTTLIVGNIYKPDIHWGQVPNAYMRFFPEGVSSRDGKILIPAQESAIKSVKLTEVGQGVRCLVFATDRWVGPGPLDWVVDVNPQQVPQGINAFLTQLGVSYDA